VADEFFQRPGVERLRRGFVAEQVVGCQILQAIGEAIHGGWIGGRIRAAALLNDEDIESLTLERQLLFHGHRPRPANEQVGEQDAEPAVPGFVGALVHGWRDGAEGGGGP